jgi:aspartyl-tRNA(Asn)/glutamyl-tRNA(Gln) amidotransferase subunit C
MAKISKDDVLKIAHMSHIELLDAEIPAIISQLEDVLTYAERVQQLAADIQEPVVKNINIFRDDIVVPADAQAILERAPQREDDFFVVPSILEDK